MWEQTILTGDDAMAWTPKTVASSMLNRRKRSTISSWNVICSPALGRNRGSSGRTATRPTAQHHRRLVGSLAEDLAIGVQQRRRLLASVDRMGIVERAERSLLQGSQHTAHRGEGQHQKGSWRQALGESSNASNGLAHWVARMRANWKCKPPRLYSNSLCS